MAKRMRLSTFAESLDTRSGRLAALQLAGTTIIVIDCAGKVRLLIVPVVLGETGGVIVAAGCATIAFRFALLYWKTCALVAVLAILLMDSVFVSGP